MSWASYQYLKELYWSKLIQNQGQPTLSKYMRQQQRKKERRDFYHYHLYYELELILTKKSCPNYNTRGVSFKNRYRTLRRYNFLPYGDWLRNDHGEKCICWSTFSWRLTFLQVGWILIRSKKTEVEEKH